MMRSLRRASGIVMLRSITKTASARRVVGNVGVPMLMITAQDDPFVPYESFFSRAGYGHSRDPVCGAGAWRALLVYLQARWQGEILGGGSGGRFLRRFTRVARR